jgi:hypothetical protein
MSAAGTHIRVEPEGLNTSTRVVTSKVRQRSDSARSARKGSEFRNVKLAGTIPAACRKSRRFKVDILCPWRDSQNQIRVHIVAMNFFILFIVPLFPGGLVLRPRTR